MASEVQHVTHKKAKRLAPYVRAIMAFGHIHDFTQVTSDHHKRIVNEELETKGSLCAPLNVRIFHSYRDKIGAKNTPQEVIQAGKY
jgi:hypothetical protein